MPEKETPDKHLKWYERTLIVNPKVQKAFIYYSLSLGLMFFAAGGVFMALVQRLYLIKVVRWDLLTTVDAILLELLVFVILFAVYVGFVFTNHVAGPIFRLLRELNKVNQGLPLEKIAFRKKDYFHELAEAYNLVVDKLKDSGSQK